VKALLAFTPLLEEENYTSQNHKESMEFILEVYDKDISTNVICLVGENCNVNKALADLCDLPLIGCAAHRFNLAVQAYLGSPLNEANLTKVINKLIIIIIIIIII
jgi:hypothetical protein